MHIASAKDPSIYAKETYTTAKGPNTSAKEPYTDASVLMHLHRALLPMYWGSFAII